MIGDSTEATDPFEMVNLEKQMSKLPILSGLSIHL